MKKKANRNIEVSNTFVRFIQLYNISFIKRVTRKFHIVASQQQLCKEMYKKVCSHAKLFFMLIRPTIIVHVVFFLPFLLPSHLALYEFIFVLVDYS